MEYGKIEHCLLFMRNVRCVLETNTRKIKPNIDKYIKETTTQIYKRTKTKINYQQKLFDENILYRTDVIYNKGCPTSKSGSLFVVYRSSVYLERAYIAKAAQRSPATCKGLGITWRIISDNKTVTIGDSPSIGETTTALP